MQPKSKVDQWLAAGVIAEADHKALQAPT